MTLFSFLQGLRPISISLSPNTEKDDILFAFRLIFQPRLWIKGNAVQELETEFARKLGVPYAFAFNSGRSALLAILESLELKKNDEILLQAFTCNAVPNPVLWAGLKPVYVDCEKETFNIDIQDLERKITSKSRAVIIQHTFGLPANMEGIFALCEKHNLILIEDCAHALGAMYKGKQVGTFGKAAFFSFSRDKVISCVYGGMAVTSDDTLAQKIQNFQERIGYPPSFWVFQQLLHPVLLNWLILPSYKIFGKYLLLFLQQLHILSKAVHWKEKRGVRPSYFPKRLPNALALLALRQFGKLDRFNTHRREIAEFYSRELRESSYKTLHAKDHPGAIFLRFPVIHPDASRILRNAWRQNVLIGDWYTSPIAPNDTKLEAMGYREGSCPEAEKLGKTTFNLPTHINISLRDAQKIIDFIKQNGD